MPKLPCRALRFARLLLFFSAAVLALFPPLGVSVELQPAAEPWKAGELLQPELLARQLDGKGGSLPLIVYVGPHTLFAGGHIPGAVFHGAAANQQNLAEFKKWAESVPRQARLVLYCGCCPFEKCPNIRPAFVALESMGFSNLQVLLLPTSFVKDWVEKGYPLQKGS